MSLNNMNVDIHTHHVPLGIFEELRINPGHYPDVTVILRDSNEVGLAFAGTTVTELPRQELQDLSERRRWMEQQNIDHQLLSIWLDLHGYDLPPKSGERWCRLLNEWLTEEANSDPGRFSALATVPLQDGLAAARVARAAAKTGHKGVLISTWIAGRELDDPDLDPLWQATIDERLPVLLHPPFPVDNSRLHKFRLSNVIGRAWETTVAATFMMYGGVLQRFPDLQVVFLHGGGFLPYQIGRLERHVEINLDLQTTMGRRPAELLRSCYFDHIIFNPLALQLLADLVGPERIMVGSDYPFEIGDLAPLKMLDSANLTDQEKRGIAGQNACRLFNLQCNRHLKHSRNRTPDNG